MASSDDDPNGINPEHYKSDTEQITSSFRDWYGGDCSDLADSLREIRLLCNPEDSDGTTVTDKLEAGLQQLAFNAFLEGWIRGGTRTWKDCEWILESMRARLAVANEQAKPSSS